MLRLVFSLLLLWSGLAAAVHVTEQQLLVKALPQPVAVAVGDAGQWAALAGDGLRVSDADGGMLWSNAKLPASSLDVAFYKGQWFVADPVGQQLLQVTASGQLGQIIDVRNTPDSQQPPQPVAVAINDGLLFWADRANHRVCRYDLDKNIPLNCFGKRGEMDGEFQYPYQMVFDRDGYLYTLDILNARVQVFDKTGRFFSRIGNFGPGQMQLFRPNGIAIDKKRDLLFVSDSYFGQIKLFQKGEALGELRDSSGKALLMQAPTGLAWRNNTLYVAETLAGNVQALAVTDLDKTSTSVVKADEVNATQKNCLMCHLSWAQQGNQTDRQQQLPEASMLMCYSCHNGAVMDSRFRIGAGGQHASVYDTDDLKKQRHEHKRKDKLSELFPVTADKNLPCTSCHTPHTKGEGNDTLYQGHNDAWLRVPNKNGDLCERCHESKVKQAREQDVKNRGINHPLAIKLAKPPFKDAPGFTLEENLFKGLPKDLLESGGVLNHESGMICQTCHQIHGGHGDRELTALANDKGELCMTCHERQASKDKKDAHGKGIHPVNIKPKKPMKKDDQDVKLVSCQSCHQVHSGKQGTALLAEKYEKPDELCQTCHERQSAKDKDDARRKGVHPVNIEPDKADQPMKKDNKEVKFVSCQTCHNVHDGKADTALLDKGVKDAEALCQTCHDRQHAKDKEDALKKGVHPVNVEMDEPVELVKGQHTRKVGCLTCHAVHTGKPNTPALVEDHKDGQLCSHCHAGKQAVVGTDHDLRITAKDKPNRFKDKPMTGVCSACHSLHRGENKQPFMYAAKAVAADRTDKDLQQSKLQIDQLCINCHQKNGIAEKKIVKAFNHPHQDIVLRSDKNIMPLLDKHERISEYGEIACITCHDPHFWDADQHVQANKQAALIKPVGHKDNVEGTPLNSFLRRKGVDKTFCIDCHGLKALVKYKYFHDKKVVRNIGVDYLQ